MLNKKKRTISLSWRPKQSRSSNKLTKLQHTNALRRKHKSRLNLKPKKERMKLLLNRLES